MRTLLTHGLLALLAAALLSCSADERGRYRGSLYYGQGPYLMQFGLGDGSVNVVSNAAAASVVSVYNTETMKLITQVPVKGDVVTMNRISK